MKNIKNILLLFSILTFSGCLKDDDPEFCNTQDACSYCYVPEPSALVISNTPNSILVIDILDNIDNQCNYVNEYDWRANIESLELIKYCQGTIVDTTIVPIINDTYEFIDENVDIGSEYKYNLFYKDHNDGISDSSFTNTLIHLYSGVDSLSLFLINENELSVNWEYNYFANFDSEIDIINFKLIREQLNDDQNHFVSLDTLDLNYEISLDSKYSYSDEVAIEDIMKYSLFMTYDTLKSDVVVSDQLEVNFPSCSIVNWIPLNSYTIHLEWACENIINGLAEIKLKNNYNEELFSLDNIIDSKGSFTDDLSKYIDLNTFENTEGIAGEKIAYTLEWYGEGGGYDYSISYAETFPINNMVYVPSLNEFPFGLDPTGNFLITEYNTKSFYIDLYEVNDDLFLNSDSNPFIKWDDYPIIDGVNLESAKAFCINRSNSYPGITFNIPSELDWEIAASALYSNELVYDSISNDYKSSYLEKYYYPVLSGNETINCNFANYESCNGYPIKIGSFDGLDMYESISPSGLYDCSGNVREWAIKIYDYDDSREILRGGDYNSSAEDIMSTSFIFESSTTQNNGIGFRTIIYADQYLSNMRKKYEEK